MKKQALILASAIIAALALAACSSSDAPIAELEPLAPLSEQHIAFAFTDSGNAAASIGWAAEERSRADADSIEAVMPDHIGVWAFNNQQTSTARPGYGTVFQNCLMLWRNGEMYNGGENEYGIGEWDFDNDWPYAEPMPWVRSTADNPVRYKFFAYTPYEPDPTKFEVFEKSFLGWGSIEWHGIPAYTNTDYMVNQSLVVYTSLLDTVRSRQNSVQTMPMRHILSRVRFCLRLGERFAGLRVIKVKSITLSDMNNSSLTLIVRFTPKTQAADTEYWAMEQWDVETNNHTAPSDIALKLEPELADSGFLRLSDENRFADPERTKPLFSPLASLYCYPNIDLVAVKATVTYDVYDLSEQLLRKDNTATNIITLNLARNGTPGAEHSLKAGCYFDVKLTIEPKFLYALSDNDIDEGINLTVE